MVHKALAAFAFLAVTFSVAPAMGVKSTKSLLCPSCTDGCSICVCGKCVGCGWGHHSSGFWNKDCVPDCESCDDDYCADCGCDGYCNECQDGYEFGDDGYHCEIWHEPAHPKPSEKVHYEKPAPKPSKKVHYKEPFHYEEPAPKPVYVKKGKGGGGQATADADAWGGSTKTKTSTDCDGYGCHSSSSSSS